jgi:hypothetical protein
MTAGGWVLTATVRGMWGRGLYGLNGGASGPRVAGVDCSEYDSRAVCPIRAVRPINDRDPELLRVIDPCG